MSPEVHFYQMPDGSLGDRRLFTAFGSASGIGDLTVRLKGQLWKGTASGIAAGLDLRVPSGDEENLLGSGAPGVKPFVAWSASYDSFSPHFNFGYLWNGSSILAGDPVAQVSADLPDLASYVVGAEFGATSRLTFTFDVLGQYVMSAPRLVQQEFRAQDETSVFRDISFRNDSFNEISAAVGVKLGLLQSLLLDLNLLFQLDDNGLRDKVTPLVGAEYAF